MGTDPEFLIPSLAEGVKSNQRKIRIDARADAPHNPFNQRWSAVSQACNVTAVATVSDTPIQSIQRAAWHRLQVFFSQTPLKGATISLRSVR
jgi:hypothetical protein